jgi:hypothetical protein
MPVRNKRTPSNNSYLGTITGLTEEEKKAIGDSGLLDKAASKLVYDNGFILLDKDGKIIEGQDAPVIFTDKFNVEDNKIDVATDDVDSETLKINGSGSTLISIQVGNTTYTIPYANYVLLTDFNTKMATKQNKLTAGDNITIVNDVISSTGGGGSSLPTDPTDDGTYALGNKVEGGVATHEWSGTEDVDMVELPAVDTGTDGTYVLKATVASGAVTYSWVKE